MSPESSIVAACHLLFFLYYGAILFQQSVEIHKRSNTKCRCTDKKNIASAAAFLLHRRDIFSAATATLQFNALRIFEPDGQLGLNRVWHISFLCSFGWNLSNIRRFVLWGGPNVFWHIDPTVRKRQIYILLRWAGRNYNDINFPLRLATYPRK